MQLIDPNFQIITITVITFTSSVYYIENKNFVCYDQNFGYCNQTDFFIKFSMFLKILHV